MTDNTETVEEVLDASIIDGDVGNISSEPGDEILTQEEINNIFEND